MKKSIFCLLLMATFVLINSIQISAKGKKSYSHDYEGSVNIKVNNDNQMYRAPHNRYTDTYRITYVSVDVNNGKLSIYLAGDCHQGGVDVPEVSVTFYSTIAYKKSGTISFVNNSTSGGWPWKRWCSVNFNIISEKSIQINGHTFVDNSAERERQAAEERKKEAAEEKKRKAEEKKQEEAEKKSDKLISEAEKKGNESLYQIGYNYIFNNDTLNGLTDYGAFKCIKKSADSGYAPAQTAFGDLYYLKIQYKLKRFYNDILYYQDHGKLDDWTRFPEHGAFCYYKSAANQGYAPAHEKLLNLCDGYFSREVPWDNRFAAELFTRADAGDSLAISILEQKFKTIENRIEKQREKTDNAELSDYFKEAAKNGHPSAQKFLARLEFFVADLRIRLGYTSGNEGYYTSECIKLGKELLTKSAETGDMESQFLLSQHCSDKEKYDWLLKASLQGHVKATYQLGYCYEKGKGTEKSEAEAFRCYQKAAEKGDADALYSLGRCYEKGKGVAKSKDEAIIWYKKAAVQGNEEAQKWLTKKKIPWNG